ncbi:unnamed protein product [Phaedon cochleariae]|uniref:TTF-type domain-containing protein n=1 Tax=Phaedon cochleariae TaxID=80249 RepID=A0A9N9SAJ3_PHACE|nr:unnamed protein product [Phaedon cochleariae]
MDSKEKQGSYCASKTKKKSGAENAKIKKQKLMEKEASSCKKISELFGNPTSVQSVVELVEDKSSKLTEPVSNVQLGFSGFLSQNERTEDEGCQKKHATDIDYSCPVAPVPSTSSGNKVSGEIYVEDSNDGFSQNFFYKKPMNLHDLRVFLMHHPHQPEAVKEKWNARLVYNRKDHSERRWISYNTQDRALYCWICLAFGKEQSSFTQGGNWDVKHIYFRLEKHEKSVEHIRNSEAYLMHAVNKDIHTTYLSKAREERMKQVKKK